MALAKKIKRLARLLLPTRTLELAAEMRPKKKQLPKPSEKTENWREFSNSCPSITQLARVFKLVPPQSLPLNHSFSVFVLHISFIVWALPSARPKKWNERRVGFFACIFLALALGKHKKGYRSNPQRSKYSYSKNKLYIIIICFCIFLFLKW